MKNVNTSDKKYRNKSNKGETTYSAPAVAPDPVLQRAKCYPLRTFPKNYITAENTFAIAGHTLVPSGVTPQPASEMMWLI